MQSTGERFSNELQWLGLNMRYRDSSPKSIDKCEMSYCFQMHVKPDNTCVIHFILIYYTNKRVTEDGNIGDHVRSYLFHYGWHYFEIMQYNDSLRICGQDGFHNKWKIGDFLTEYVENDDKQIIKYFFIYHTSKYKCILCFLTTFNTPVKVFCVDFTQAFEYQLIHLTSIHVLTKEWVGKPPLSFVTSAASSGAFTSMVWLV